MDTLQIRGGILLRSSARLRSFAHPLDSMLCMLILLCMVILLLCVVILPLSPCMLVEKPG